MTTLLVENAQLFLWAKYLFCITYQKILVMILYKFIILVQQTIMMGEILMKVNFILSGFRKQFRKCLGVNSKVIL